MDYFQLLKAIDLPPQVERIMEQRYLQAQRLREQAMALTHETAFQAYQELAELLRDDDMGMLACQLLAAAEAHSRWAELGIPENVFLDTMKCFSRFLRETRVRLGRDCFDRGWWTWRQLSMRLFRLGTLEYELLPQCGLVSVHIPSDADLSPESVDISLETARDFLGKFYPAYAGVDFVCESWLLSPELTPFLPVGSRILAFQQRFSLHETDSEPMDCLEWLFRVPEDTPLECLPETTTLQRRVKKHLLSGGKIGTAMGVLKETAGLPEPSAAR